MNPFETLLFMTASSLFLILSSEALHIMLLSLCTHDLGGKVWKLTVHLCLHKIRFVYCCADLHIGTFLLSIGHDQPFTINQGMEWSSDKHFQTAFLDQIECIWLSVMVNSLFLTMYIVCTQTST